MRNITESVRKEIVDYLLLQEYSFYGEDLIGFLRRTWDLSSMPSTDHRFNTAEGDIWKHMVVNDDWSYQYLLLSYLHILESSDEIFLSFLESCLHPLVVTDLTILSDTLDFFNKSLAKVGYVIRLDSRVSGKPIYKAVKSNNTSNASSNIPYEIVFSFAGEDREYVEQVANFLKEKGISLFYDKYETVTLWGKNLTDHFDKVYRGSARFCVMFISEHYANKVWTTHERRSAMAKALEMRDEYILPVRFDDTDIPGLHPTIGYIDLRITTPEKLGMLITEKLGISE